ncbi:hypothetical protein JOF41_006082 [Saccharothrix coeruleofusca]|uniref:hypothetical protein n=1 Tax=Saccharothrix coeruleofusca TaxID=33919 RepID=UPI001AE8761C|nr:hypothetical protein [Saccharothrix coeruleofusca]MBP2339904.1 hypothetical protein [Saccharothrix coeruleofusca]
MSTGDQRAGTGASRVRRLLTRAALVAGGALAGSAVVWALSAAPASAQVAEEGDALTSALTSATERTPLTGAVAPVVEPVTGAVADLDATLRAPSELAREAAPADLGQVAHDIGGTVGQMGTLFQPEPERPAVAAVLPQVDVVGRTATVSAPSLAPTQATAHPAPVAELPVPEVPEFAGTFHELSKTWPALSAQHLPVLAAEEHPTLPGDPSRVPSMPFAPPASAPAHCSCGGDGSGSAGGGSASFASASAHRTASATGRAALPGDERNTVTPGKQPGITPD